MRKTNETNEQPAFSHHVLSPQSTPFMTGPSRSPSPEEVRAYMDRAHQMRGEAMIAAVSAIGRAFRTLLPRRGAATSGDGVEAFRNSLSGLRASAEILRDEPEVSPARRRRLVEIILREEQRLEGLVGAMTRGRGGSERA